MLDAALRFKTKEPEGSQNGREGDDKEEIIMWDYNNIDEYCDGVWTRELCEETALSTDKCSDNKEQKLSG